MFNSKLLVLLLSLVLTACIGGGKKSTQDGAPRVDKKKLALVHDAVVRRDKVTKAGNKDPYTVFGKTYHLLKTSEGYKKKGTASWYGTKFHGRKTANGEDYSVYKMTAAHTTLPIPCYVRVTNLSNNRKVIVRVNDRGPFHGNRLIDLSYAAAVKLGYAEQGTASVLVEVVTEESLARERGRLPIPVANSPSLPSIKKEVTRAAAIPVVNTQVKAVESGPANWFLQTGAYRERETAVEMKNRVKYITHLPVALRAPKNATDGFFKVFVGPAKSEQELRKLQQEMQAAKMGSPFIVRETESKI